MDLSKDFHYMFYRAPSIRYHDTSYIINQKWFKGGDELAFPLMHHYINLDGKIYDRKKYYLKSDHYFTDSETINYSKKKRICKDKPQRHSKSLELRNQLLNSADDAFTTTDDDFFNDDQESKKKIQSKKKYSLLIDESDQMVVSLDKSLNNCNNKNNNKNENIEINIITLTAIPKSVKKSNAYKNDIKSDTDKDNEEITNDEEAIAIMKEFSNESVNQPKAEKSYYLNSNKEELVSVDIHPRPTSSSSTISSNILQINEDVTDNVRLYYVNNEKLPSFLCKDQIYHDVESNQLKRTSLESLGSNITNISTGSSKTVESSSKNDNQVERVFNQNFGNEVELFGNNFESISIRNEHEDNSSIDGFMDVQLRVSKRDYDNELAADSNNVPKSQSKSFEVDHLRLHYITQRILASILPKNQEGTVREHIYQSIKEQNEAGLQEKNEKDLILMLEQKHGKNYRIFDLQSCISVITLEKLCELCKHIDKWLGSSQNKVVVLQDCEDRQRLGIAIATYLEYLDICGYNCADINRNLNNDRLTTQNEDLRVQNAISKNWLDLDIFSMKKFLEDFVGPLKIPSHKRYLKYFSGLLSGKIRMNSSPVLLNYILVESPPNLLQYNGLPSDSEWNTFVKIYEGLHCVFTSDIHIIPITTRQFLFEIGNLQLRGDILIRCYQILNKNAKDQVDRFSRKSTYNNENRDLLYSLQFHTCAMTSTEVIFRKNDLDYAWCDNRFPSDCKVSLRFQNSEEHKAQFIQSPLIRTESVNLLAEADSIEDFDLTSKYEGPVNGNIYAAILKTPKTINTFEPSPLTTQRSSSLSVHLCSPSRETPQLNGSQNENEVDQSFINSSTPTRKRRSVDFNTRKKLFNGSTVLIRETESQPKTNNNYFVDTSLNSSQLNFNEDHVSERLQTQNFQLNRNCSAKKPTVKNPLTLSLDSGISSSGLINRRQQCISKSPSSFRSQTSPRDRHKELDDILNDMLMTVQDIPDYNTKAHKQRLIRSSSASATSSAPPTYFLLPATHRSRSYTASYGNIIPSRDRDFYDTASTATTITPTPSESGRNTPTAQQNNNIFQIQERQRSNTISSMASSNITTTAASSSLSHIHNNNINHDQSSLYSQKRRTRKISFSETEDEDNIPYHARESSKPFTYGNVPNGHQLLETGNLVNGEKIIESVNLEENIVDSENMIKLQPGLSSPSLVRKQLGQRTESNTSFNKIQQNNNFEDIVNKHRDKYDNDKFVAHQQLFYNNYANKANEYYYYNDPLKRSYTLEGFHRSNSTDGLSGSTWLQMQQQKLRAKKTQQISNEQKYVERIHTEIRNRPLKSRIRNDGYASDTAAFGDEIDYRTPLVVQTQYYTKNSPEQKYNTIQTTGRSFIESKERPFVAVKRAHEQARNIREGSPPLSPLSLLKASSTGPLIQFHLHQLQSPNNQNDLLSIATQSKEAELFENSCEANNNFTVNACKNVIMNNSSINYLNKDEINNFNNESISNGALLIQYETTDNSNYYSLNNAQTDLNEVTDFKGYSHSTNNNHNISNNHNYSNNNHNNNNNNSNNNIKNNTYIYNKNNDNKILLNERLVFDQLLSALTIEADLMAQILETSLTSKNNKTNDIEVNTDEYKTSSYLCSATPSDRYINCDLLNENCNMQLHPKQFFNLCNNNNNHNHNHNHNNNNNYNNNNNNINNNNNNINKVNLNASKKDQYVKDFNKILNKLNEFNKYQESENSFLNDYRIEEITTGDGSKYNYSSDKNLILLNNGIPKHLINTHFLDTFENYSSISPSLSERSNNLSFWYDQKREESVLSYRLEKEAESSTAESPRPETPAFPITPRNPFGVNNDGSISPALPPKSPTSLRNANPTNSDNETQEVAAHHVKFVRDSSKYWYKPNISREEAIHILRHAEPGTFLVRDSTTFKNAFGLVVRVAHPPIGVQLKPGGDELVRHFLVEPTAFGVRLKGCANEPVFSSLSALVYQHSITPLALQCRLNIPEQDIQLNEIHTPAQKQLLSQGAACNVLYLYSCDTESLTGIEAVRRAVNRLYAKKPLPTPTEVHFKVSTQGITLTDNSRQKFFRKYYSAHIISFCGFDPDRRTWSIKAQGDVPVNNKIIFAFVARRSSTSHDNQCHIFCDLQANQPATAIVSFANKVLPTEKFPNQQI